MRGHDLSNAGQPRVVQGARNPAQWTEPRKTLARRGEARGAKAGGKGRRGEEERGRREVRRREAEVRTQPNTGETSRDKRQHHYPSVHNNESLEYAEGYFVFFSGERPKSRFRHVVRDSYPQFVHFSFSEVRFVACSRSLKYKKGELIRVDGILKDRGNVYYEISSREGTGWVLDGLLREKARKAKATGFGSFFPSVIVVDENNKNQSRVLEIHSPDFLCRPAGDLASGEKHPPRPSSLSVGGSLLSKRFRLLLSVRRFCISLRLTDDPRNFARTGF